MTRVSTDEQDTQDECPSPMRRPMRLRGLLVRGESMIAFVGIAVAGILLATMAGAGFWVLRAQQESAEAARTRQIESVAALLAQSSEVLLTHGEGAAVRRMVMETGHTYGLEKCRIVLADGQVVASMDAAEKPALTLPKSWNSAALPDAAVEPTPGRIQLAIPIRIGTRGMAQLEMSGNVGAPLWSYWETQAGMGSIGAAGMMALWVVYRRTRRRLRALSAIREALMTVRASGGASRVPAAALSVNGDLGPEAQAWNAVVKETERQRKSAVAERARDALDRRRTGGGDLDAACDAMTHGLLLADESGVVKYVNGAAASFLRTDRERLMGAEVSRHLQVPSVVDAIRQIGAGGMRRRVVLDVASDTPAPGAGGEKARSTNLRFTIRPVRRDDSASVMVIIEDVTQQKAAEEARHSFVAQATHELRTPLTNIRLYVETAIEDGENDPATRARCLNVINGETRRLERIVGEMLSVAEIEAGSFALNRDDVRMDALLAELESDFRAAAQDKSIALRFELPPKMPVIQGDRDKIVMAIHNLVGNALKYTPTGGQVTVTIADDARQLVLSVRDTGIGVSPDEQERIFERFYRANDARVSKITGTGLGLTLAREVARLHGGDITCESVINQGSRFTMTLPIVAVAAAA